MKTILYFTILFTTFGMNIYAQQSTFQKVYGGTGIKQDYTYDMHKTSDGGYILGGVTENYPTGVRRSYMIKTDANGDTLWTSIFGDTCTTGAGPYPPQQYINDLSQTSDGGYIAAGGMALCGSAGAIEGGQITRLDAGGNVLWSKTCSYLEDPYPVIQCNDGNFIFGGYVIGIGAGLEDACLTKIDVNGDTIWSRTYGGPGNEWFYHILQTPDSGYLAAGYSDGFGLGVIDTNRNIYLVKTDANGNLQWSKAYGTSNGNEFAFGHCTQPTTDGGYIITGSSSNGIFLLKIDALGNMKWAKYFSGEFGHAVKQTSDKGYLIAGTGNYGSTGDDVVLIKTDSLGTLQWSRTFGGNGNESGWLLDIANDGGYVTGGWTRSFGNLAEHIYFVKTDANGNSSCNENASPGVVESVAPFVSSNAPTQVMRGPNTTSFTPLFQRAGTVIYLCSTALFPVEYRSGWNLVSVPTMDTNMNANVLFPNKISSVFKYDGGYKTTGTLINGQGYWIKTASAEENDFNGQPLDIDTIQLVTGWNMIGTIGYPVTVDSLEEQPAGIISSNFFGYNGSYFITDSLQPGQGYWVKANHAGSVIVKKSGLGARATYKNIPRNVSASEIPPAPDQTTGVKGINFPREFALSENYPNPFNPTTIIHYDLPIAVHVRLTISDVLGREVATLVNELQQPGSKSVEFNSTALPSGVYFYRIVAGDFVQTKKMVLMK